MSLEPNAQAIAAIARMTTPNARSRRRTSSRDVMNYLDWCISIGAVAGSAAVWRVIGAVAGGVGVWLLIGAAGGAVGTCRVMGAVCGGAGTLMTCAEACTFAIANTENPISWKMGFITAFL